MLERMQLFPLNFYKKAKFNGSMGKMNYRLAKEEKKTDEENIPNRKFPFAEEGICQAMDWFNEEGEKMNREV